MKLHEIVNKKYFYQGNCVDSFEDDSCSFGNYRDVSDFAVAEEAATKISKKQFLTAIEKISVVDDCDIFMFDEDNDVYIAYDSDADIHYFFTK